jgi:uncharacterized membrane protein HdeD (DUF308 family)
MTDTLSTDRTDRFLWGLALSGAVVSLVLGILFLVWPDETLHVGAVLFGLWLLFHGIVHLFTAVTAHAADGLHRALRAVIGLLFVIAGVLCLRDVVVSLLIIATIIGISWLIGGIVALVEAFADFRGGPARWIVAGFGGLSVLGGLIVLIWPGPSLTTIVVLTGVWLLLLGAMQLVLVLRSRPSRA